MYWAVALTEANSQLAAGEPGTTCFMVEAPAAAEVTGPAEGAATAPATRAKVLRNANLRAGPGTNFARMGMVRTGTEITVVGSNPAGDWYQLDNGAWIAAYLIRLKAGPLPGPRDQAARPDWVDIPAGPFIMGSSEEDVWAAVATCNAWEGSCEFGWFDSELPRRTVTLPAYGITRYEITSAQYQACVDAGVCAQAGQRITDDNIAYDARFVEPAYPVAGVSWYDANGYCHWLGARLPTEEEWEKAARGRNGRSYPWGSSLDTALANLYSGAPAPVGSYAAGASPYGVEDMAGNVFEWTSSSVNGRFVLRGGSWHAYPFRARTADRGTKLAPDFASYDIGFRCAR